MIIAKPPHFAVVLSYAKYFCLLMSDAVNVAYHIREEAICF